MTSPPVDTVAVVLTHQRPRLATALVRSLLEEEGLGPEQIVLVIDRDGGLEDAALEQRLRVIRLLSNSGPAAGFRAGMAEAFSSPHVQWAYLCEDDVLLSGIPRGRLAGLRDAIENHAVQSGSTPGAVAAYGRRFRPRRGGTTLPFVPDSTRPRLQPIDVAAWGATLVHRSVHEAGIEPDDHWFFGYEDFDFFLKVSDAGHQVLVDAESAYLAREDAQGPALRPVIADEPWRAYYVARNFFELARRHGDLSWTAWHVALTLRRFQLADNARARRAMLAGLLHGVTGRSGRDPRWVREVGEWDPDATS